MKKAMRVVILHTFIEEAGGGERVALSMARAMRELGHDVDLYSASVSEAAWSLLASPGDPMPRRLKLGLWPYLLRSIGGNRLHRLIVLEATANALKALKGAGGYDVYVVTSGGVPLNSDMCYIHFPAAIDLAVRRGGALRRAYDWLVAREARRVVGRPLAVLANSTWTAGKVREAYGLEARVLHPPVEVGRLLALGDRKEDVVLTVSRFTPEKNLEAIVQVASMVPEAEFYLVGSTSSYSAPVLERVRSLADELKVRNLHVETDVPRRRLEELYSIAKIYLHPPFPEHFGIAIAEGVAAGAVPVVYRDGGGWTDIASRIDPMLGYTTVEGAASIVRSLLRDEARRAALAERAREVARGFSHESFKADVAKVMDELARLKGRRDELKGPT